MLVFWILLELNRNQIELLSDWLFPLGVAVRVAQQWSLL